MPPPKPTPVAAPSQPGTGSTVAGIIAAYQDNLLRHLARCDVVGVAGTTRLKDSHWGSAGVPSTHGQVLQSLDNLGAGFQLASHDLDIRGAGNLLGSEQSGFVHSVGFDLYLRLLDETVRQLSETGGQKAWIPADVSLDFPSFLPDDYVTSQEAKLDVYRRLTVLREPKDIEALQLEVRDRFGPMPTAAHALFASAILRVLGADLGVEGVLVRASEARVSFRADAVPRLKGLSAAFHGVQFQVDVRRTQPLALKLTRLGGAEMLEGLVRALRALAP